MLRIFKRVGIGVAAVVGLLLLWGAVEPRVYLDVEEHVAEIPNLDAEWEGAEIAVIADLQIGMWGANSGMIRRVIRHLVEKRPAAVLLSGDFIYKPGDDPAGEIRAAIELITR
jgi:predicted MPP superfamily phosphohydrolase